MDRHVAQSGLENPRRRRSGVSFAVATRADDADIRRLLAQNDIGGWVNLALTREPDAFAPHAAFGHAGHFIVARNEDTGEAIGLCEYSVGAGFVNGEEKALPYLGSLRIAPRYRNRIAILKGGFDLVHSLQRQRGDPPLVLTSIAAENHKARRVLTADLPGMPVYHPVGDLVTLAKSIHQRGGQAARVRQPEAGDLAALAARLNRHGRKHQFSPIWDVDALRHVFAHGGLSLADFRVIPGALGFSGCIAVWDQRSFKQVVVAGYAPWLARLRLVINAGTRFTRLPQLPKAGRSLEQVYLSPFTCGETDAESALSLIAAALGVARAKGAEIALLGIAGNHPLRRAIKRRFSAREYVMKLYLVFWKGEADPAIALDGRRLQPEIAML